MEPRVVLPLYLLAGVGVMLLAAHMLWPPPQPQQLQEHMFRARQARPMLAADVPPPAAAPPAAAACAYNGRPSDFPCVCAGAPPARYAVRPRLLIVMSETFDRQGKHEGTARVADNFRRYCERHGYLFKHHFYDKGRHLGVFGTRWEDLFQYWDVADWLLHVDSDTIVTNLSAPLDPYLDLPEHVLLHMRTNREVTAAAVAFRTSEFSRCFVRRWLGIHEARDLQGRAINSDNGALLLMLEEALAPDVARQCADVDPGNEQVWLNCFERIFPLLHTAHEHMPVRVFPPFGGFWRAHEGLHPQPPPLADNCTFDEALSSAAFYRCWSNDVLASGWKGIGTGMWAKGEVDNGTAKLATCPFNSPEDELRIAKACCYVGYPGCRAAGGANVCLEQPHCRDPGAGEAMRTRAAIGFGICLTRHVVEVLPDPFWRRSPGLPDTSKCQPSRWHPPDI